MDDYDHELYKKNGFGRFDQVENDKLKEIDPTNLLKFFSLGPRSLWNYATQALSMAPLEGSVDWTNLPEGGLRNGGTLVVKGEEVIFHWKDTIPSDFPSVQTVLDTAVEASEVDNSQS